MKNFNRRSSHGHHGSKRRELTQHAHSRCMCVYVCVCVCVCARARVFPVKGTASKTFSELADTMCSTRALRVHASWRISCHRVGIIIIFPWKLPALLTDARDDGPAERAAGHILYCVQESAPSYLGYTMTVHFYSQSLTLRSTSDSLLYRHGGLVVKASAS